jgi:hypothetical protein
MGCKSIESGKTWKGQQPAGFIIWDRLRGTIEVTVIFLDFATIVVREVRAPEKSCLDLGHVTGGWTEKVKTLTL